MDKTSFILQLPGRLPGRAELRGLRGEERHPLRWPSPTPFLGTSLYPRGAYAISLSQAHRTNQTSLSPAPSTTLTPSYSNLRNPRPNVYSITDLVRLPVLLGFLVFFAVLDAAIRFYLGH